MKRRIGFLTLWVPILFFALAHFAFAATVTRGPYLQQSTPAGIVIRWRTDTATDSRVRFGTTLDAPGGVADNSIQTTEHEVAISGLAPNTRYYYSVGSSTETLSGGDGATYFFTAPAVGSTDPVRIWTFGDAGQGDANQFAVRDAYYNFAPGARTDLFLLLGDNAYTVPTDAEYQAKVFDVYAELLKQTPVWSTFGNHEGFSSVSLLQAGVYYDSFTFPKNGEAGGAPSGTEAYYSFDYANIHFICLNSHDIPRAAFGDMMNWLRADLAQNARQWTIAYFHHPPYSKGSHDSDNPLFDPDTPDSAASIREMREIALPILEQAGVDLVLTGHSHSYERSFLLDGHYGLSSTLAETMKIDAGDGKIFGDGFYRKTPNVADDSHAGTVYAVVGTGGGVPAGGSLDHPVMIESINNVGSMVIDVSGSQLDAMFLDDTGAIRDNFSIRKGATYPAAPQQRPVRDDNNPDQINGVDRDGKYRLSWTYPRPPVEQPCKYRIEEAVNFNALFADDGAESLSPAGNSKWTSDGQWISAEHSTTSSQGYAVVYTVQQDTSLTMTNSIALPAGQATILSFDSREDIEKNFDYGLVEISVAGAPFETLAQFTGAFIGKRTVDLSAFAGQTVKIRFRFTSDYVTAPPQAGWSIDNINVESSNFVPIAAVGASALQLDIKRQASGNYAYRVNGLFGNCAANPAAGPYSVVRQIAVAR